MPEVTKPKLSKSHRAALLQIESLRVMAADPGVYLIEVQPLKPNGQPKGHTVMALSGGEPAVYGRNGDLGVKVSALLITKNSYENGSPRYRRVSDGE
jgi:hypothetical protein